jgi:hypothetical protein
VLDSKMPFFRDGRAHDAFEFLVQLLDFTHNDIRVIARLFDGSIVAVRKLRCGIYEQGDDQPAFWMLPLPPRRGPLYLADCVKE